MKWAEIMDITFMSSEESGREDNAITIHPLPWVTDEVNAFKEALDNGRYSALTAQAKRQMKTRKIGEKATREKPNGSGWIFTD